MRPLPYHVDIVELLRREEPELWAWMAGGRIADQSAELRQSLLRSTYRLDRDGHADLLDAAADAATAVGVGVPVAVYQTEGGSTPNASLVFVPDEAIVLLSGPIVDMLDDAELTAVLGHELAHHTLWTMEGGDHLVADRLVDAMAAEDPGVAGETARRLRLATELFADRGALLACGSLHAAVGALVKVATGTRSIVPASYLRQAAEVLASKPSPSSGPSHPETFIRAQALSDWSAGHDLTPDVRRALHGPVDVERLDLVDQRQVAALTRQVIVRMLEPAWVRTDDVMAQARAFFADVLDPADLTWPADAELAPGTERYLAYVLLDLATADPDLERAPLAHASLVASAIGIAAPWSQVVAEELGRDAVPPAVVDG